MQKLTRTCSSDSFALLTLFIVFGVLYIINMHQSLFLYVLNYPDMHSLSEKESGCTHTGNCVYLSKIENSSYHQELVSHPIPEHVDELSSLVRIKLQYPFPDNY